MLFGPPALLDELSDGVLLLHPSGRLLYANPAARSWLGLTKDAPLPDGLRKWFAPAEAWSELLAGREQAQVTGNGILFQATASHQDDQIVILLQPTSGRTPERVGRLLALDQVSRELNATGDIRRVLEIALTESLRATDFTCGDIVLLDLASNTCVEQVARGCPPGVARNVELEVEIVRSRQLRFIPDPMQAGVLPGHPGVHAALIVPFWYQATVAGLIHLHSATPLVVDRNIIEFMEILAAQTAVAVGSAQRYQEQLSRNAQLRRRAEQVVQMAKVGRVIRSDQSLEETLEDLVYAIQESVGFNVVLLSLVEGKDDERVMRRVAVAGIPLTVFEELKQVKQPYAKVVSLLRDEFRIGGAYLIPEQQQEVYRELLDTYTPLERKPDLGPEDWHIHDLFLIPLRSTSGEILGMLSLDAPRDGRRPTVETVDPIEVFASQAAISIENARLYAEARQRAAELDQRTQRLTTLIGTSAAISRSLDTQYIAQVITQEAAAIVDVEQSSLVLFDYQAGIGRMIAHYPPLPDDTPPITIPIKGNPATEQVIDTGQPLAFEDAQNHPMMAPVRELMIEHNVQSIIIVPLLVGGRVIGTLGLDSTRARRIFTDEEISLAQTIANQAAVALENARLFDQTRQRTQVQEALLKVGATLVSTRELPDLFQQVINTAVETIPHATEGIIHIYDSGADRLTAKAVSRATDRVSASKAGVGMKLGVGVAGIALATQRTINIPDAQASEHFVQGKDPPRFCSLLVTPLVAEDRLLGTISVTSPETDAFSVEDENVLALLATQTAVALENARLHTARQSTLDELQERADRLALVNRLSAEFGSTLNSQEIMDTVVHEMARITGVDQCNLVLFDPDRGYGTIHAEHIPIKDAESRTIPMEGNPSYDLLVETRRPLSIEDVSTHPATALLAPRYEVDGVKSMLIVPLLVQDRLIGSVGLNVVGRPRKFSDAEVETCAIICNQAAIALENARLYEEVHGLTAALERRVEERTHDLARERDRVSALLRITSELSTSLDLDRVLYRALELVGEEVNATQGSIFLVDQMTNELVYRAEVGRAEPLPPGGKRLPFGRDEGLAGWLTRQRQAAVVNDTRTDERWKPLPELPEDHRSVLAAPLIAGDDVVGVLMLFSLEPNAFSELQLELVEAAALQVAPAIYNAELYKLIREQADQLGGMMRAEREEAAKSAAMLESVADGVMVVDSYGKVILFNAAAERMLDLERSHILNEPISKFIGLWGKAGVTWGDAIEEWTRSPDDERGRPFLDERFELGEKVVSVHLSPVLSSGSGFLPDFLGTVSVFRDITKDVELDRLQREWVSTVSHELRTPMTSIKGYADLLMLGAVGSVPENQRRFLEIIKNNADRLSSLVNDLLDISRIETGRMKLALGDVNLYDLIETVMDNLHGRREQEEKEIAIQSELSDDLPLVRGDVDRVTQILTNLLDNAFNYTLAGGSITLSAQVHSVDQFVQIKVVDTGIGISVEDQAKIFDRFYRSDHPSVQEVSGTGLGLAIVRQLVEMHGGQMKVYSGGARKGSTFSFTLPFA